LRAAKTSTISFWRIAATTPNYHCDDMTRSGAKKTGGRWNSAGIPVIYSSGSIALAVLETFVHLASAPTLPLNRYLVEIKVPSDLFITAIPLNTQVGWDAEPPGLVSTNARNIWANSNAGVLAKVPSVIVREEFNYLVNPAHPEAASIKATAVRKWLYDPRLK
jgi:RES domain-containing protein